MTWPTTIRIHSANDLMFLMAYANTVVDNGHESTQLLTR